MCRYIKKFGMIEQNESYFWNQHIKVVLNQLKTP